MGGATLAQQLPKTNNNAFLAAFNADSSRLDDNNPGACMDNLIPSTHGWPIEDLTGEVHDLMLRESMTWLPWVDENDTNSSVKGVFPMEGFDSQLLAQTLQLDGLFGQELNLDHVDEATPSFFYDELTFDSSPVTTPLSSPTEQHPTIQDFGGEPSPVDLDATETMTPAISPTCEECVTDQGHESFEETGETEQEEQDDASRSVSAYADLQEDDSSTDDDGDDDDGDSEDEEDDGPVSVMTTTYMYLPKRQVEEALLTKITQHLQPDKLPGILSIVSSTTDNQNDGEVEIDLSCLVREQLVRVMLYVDACIAEQQGGNKVKLSDYMVKEELSKLATTMATVVDDDDDDDDDKTDTTIGKKRRRRRKQLVSSTPDAGPMSMAALTKKSKPKELPLDTTILPSLSPTTTGPKRRRTRKKQQDASVSIPVNAKYQDPNCLASTRPKRRSTALHKRRMLEEMLLVPSDDDENMNATIEDDGLDHQVMVTYGEEEMDFRVVENQTIAHQPFVSSLATPGVPMALSNGDDVSTAIDDEDDDEEIDIM
ncbi:unnamed protein product [Absidia cylindrospora]